jgi:hypothetical protein
MLYTLITFVALFVIATTAAVIYYVRAEELRTTRDTLQNEMDTMVSREESRNLGTIVGARLPGKSNLGTVVEHLDQAVMLVKGTPVRATTAEVKLTETRQAIQPLFERARTYIPLAGAAATAVDPNAKADPNRPADPNAAAPVQVALTDVIRDLLAELDKVTQARNSTEQALATLKGRFDDAVADMEKTKNDLTARVNACEQQVNAIKGQYAQLSATNDQSTKQQLGILQGDLAKAQTNAKQLNDELLKTQAEHNVTLGRLQGALTQLSDIRPAPDKEAPAFQPDGAVILVDQPAGVVRINLGSEDRIYQGLTFSVYDRSAGIPRDGKPKAQVEIFAIDSKVATARVLSSDRRNPIAVGDHIANLIWDASQQNQFVVVGDFDTDGDGRPDYDGVTRIEAMIQKWGGVSSTEVTALTDYVILGAEPKVPAEPTVEIQTADPTARERYDAAKARNERYQQIRAQAQKLCVPIFNYDRFLYFTGYANQTGRPGAL